VNATESFPRALRVGWENCRAFGPKRRLRTLRFAHAMKRPVATCGWSQTTGICEGFYKGAVAQDKRIVGQRKVAESRFAVGAKGASRPIDATV
jgi:hypothetical protein